jgi:hypothetical protein
MLPAISLLARPVMLSNSAEGRTARGLVTYYVLTFMRVASWKVRIAGFTTSPNHPMDAAHGTERDPGGQPLFVWLSVLAATHASWAPWLRGLRSRANRHPGQQNHHTQDLGSTESRFSG